MGAYWVWTHEAAPDLAEGIVVLAGDRDDLEEVVYRGETEDVTVQSKKDDLGTYATVTITNKPKPAPKKDDEEGEDDEAEDEGDKAEGDKADGDKPKDKADAEADNAEGKAEEGETEAPKEPEVAPPVTFKAGRSGEDLLKALAPFKGERELTVAADKLADLGLAEPKATVSIKRAGKEPRVYEIGDNTYGGASVYVREVESGKIFLVAGRVLSPLKTAERNLADRELFDAAEKDIESIDVKQGDKTATYAQQNRDDASAVFWAKAGATEKDDIAAGWIDKALRLRSTAYVQSGEEPTNAEEALVFTINAKGKATTVRLLRAYDAEGEEEWFAESEFTRGMVKIMRARAAELHADANSLWGEAPTEADKPAANAAPAAMPPGHPAIPGTPE